jgi:hypothetical protein
MRPRKMSTRVRPPDWDAFKTEIAALGLSGNAALGWLVDAAAGRPDLLADLARADVQAPGQGPEWRVPRSVSPLAGDEAWDRFAGQAAGLRLSTSQALAVLVHSVARGQLALEVKVVLRVRPAGRPLLPV